MLFLNERNTKNLSQLISKQNFPSKENVSFERSRSNFDFGLSNLFRSKGEVRWRWVIRKSSEMSGQVISIPEEAEFTDENLFRCGHFVNKVGFILMKEQKRFNKSY